VQHGALPAGVTRRRTTDTFDARSVPPGLLRAHRVAVDTWGLIEVVAGRVTFVWEDGVDEPIELVAGDTLVIPPDVAHHVEPDVDARFVVSFHR
jgi:tellurite methyltransferase